MIHCTEYFSCVFFGHFHKGVLIVHIDGTDQFTRYTALSGNRPNNISWFCFIFLTDINEKADHACFLCTCITKFHLFRAYFILSGAQFQEGRSHIHGCIIGFIYLVFNCLEILGQIFCLNDIINLSEYIFHLCICNVI